MKKNDREIRKGLARALAVFATIAVYALSWIITCAVLMIVAELIGLSFTWKTATGLWLLFMFLRRFARKENK